MGLLLWRDGLADGLLDRAGVTDPTALSQHIDLFLSQHLLWSSLLYHVAGILIFGLWYGLLRKRRARAPLRRVFPRGSAAALFLTGVGLQLLTSCALSLVEILWPAALQNYNELMEGISELTPMSLLLTVVLAPMGEELLCRGVVLHYAQKASGRFWVANLIQATIFGVIHLNWVQGSYAFVFGCVLGAVCHRHRSVWASIALHAIINLAGMLVVEPLFAPVPEKLAFLLPLLGLFVLLCWAGLHLDQKILDRQEKLMEQEAADGQ